MDRGVRAWLALALLLVLLGLVGQWPQREHFDWQPALALRQPWRMLSAVAVHYNDRHLLANLAGALLVGALGWAARATAPMVWAWALSWPLTHLALIVEPGLLHYGGLSGVLHAGVAVVAVQLALAREPGARRIGAAILLGVLLKIGTESPWSPPRFHAGLGISVAPLAHATGVLAGLLCAIAAHALTTGRRRAGPR